MNVRRRKLNLTSGTNSSESVKSWQPLVLSDQRSSSKSTLYTWYVEEGRRTVSKGKKEEGDVKNISKRVKKRETDGSM